MAKVVITCKECRKSFTAFVKTKPPSYCAECRRVKDNEKSSNIESSILKRPEMLFISGMLKRCKRQQRLTLSATHAVRYFFGITGEDANVIGVRKWLKLKEPKGGKN